jgi:DNA-binding FadR family transcriptional regulator
MVRPIPALARSSMAGKTGSRTLAMRLAHAIEQEIIGRGWPVGEGLGSEAQLMERYQVGRSVLREAVRILESRWVARPRPGPGGGLVVTAPDPDGVRDATRVFLDFARVRPDHLLETWLALETVAVAELAATIDAAGIRQLQKILHGEGQSDSAARSPGAAFHMEIARLAGNPAIELFIHVLIDLVHPMQPDDATRENLRWEDPAHREIVDAIIVGEAALAQHHMRSCVQRHARATAVAAAKDMNAPWPTLPETHRSDHVAAPGPSVQAERRQSAGPPIPHEHPLVPESM